MNNKPCLARHKLIDLIPNKLRYYLFMISLKRYKKVYNKLDVPSTKTCVLNVVTGVNVKLYNMMTRIDKSKSLVKHILSDCKCRFDSEKSNSNQKWNKDKCWCECKKSIKIYVCKKMYMES